MSRRLAPLVAVCALAATGPALADDVVFTNVSVLTMSDQGMLDEVNVTVRDGSIESISSGGEIADGTTVVDGTGKLLMPGLADMHVHYWSAVEGPAYLANSVTTVRNLWGSTVILTLDAEAKAGVIVAPHAYTSGPLMDGPEPIWGDASVILTSPEQAVGAVESQRKTGFRAVKLYEGLTPDIYRAAVAAAKERDMQVWTHTPNGMSVEEVIELEVDSIEHFEDISESVYLGSETDIEYHERWAEADERRLREIAELSAVNGVWHSPTYAVIAKRYEYGANPEAFFEQPESTVIGPGLADWWRGSAMSMGDYDKTKQKAAENQRALIKMLYDAGAPLLIGTDTPNPFVLPGYAIHDEIAAFVEAGIPVEDVLKIATSEAARFLREEGQWGVVAEGARADLVLLNGDPREDLDLLRTPAGVMVNGHWYDAERLAAELAETRETVANDTTMAPD